MHDIDAQINKISGQANYMEQLSKVTGNIFTVDRVKYHEVIDKCSRCDFNLDVISKRMLSNKTINADGKQLFKAFLDEKQKYDIANKTFEIVGKKAKEQINYQHSPVKVVASEWFKAVRDIERSTRRFLKQFFEKPDEATWEGFNEKLEQVPELHEVTIFCGINVDSNLMFMNVFNAYRCAKIIINSFIDPMYDVEGTIRKNYHLIERIFKTSPREVTQHITSPNDIINILTKFIIAKYRATVTSNNKHYIKLFMNLVDDSSSANIDGAKFMDIMDSINLDQLNKQDNVYKFALGAKTAINNIFTNDKLDADEIIASIQSIFEASASAKPKDTHEDHAIASKYDDLL